jgi:hypothetical protein
MARSETSAVVASRSMNRVRHGLVRPLRITTWLACTALMAACNAEVREEPASADGGKAADATKPRVRDAWTDAGTADASQCVIDAATSSFLGIDGYRLKDLPAGHCAGDEACWTYGIAGPFCNGQGHALNAYTCECVHDQWDCVLTAQGEPNPNGTACDDAAADAMKDGPRDGPKDGGAGDADEEAGGDGGGDADEIGPPDTSIVAVDAGRDGGIVTLAQGFVRAMAIDDTTLFLLTESAVVTLPIAGGQVTTLASEGAMYPDPDSLVLAGGHVVWNDLFGGIMTCPKSGCDGIPTNLVSNQSAYALAANATSIYWAYRIPQPNGAAYFGGMAVCSPDGCGGMVDPIASGSESDQSAVVDSENVYWAGFNDDSTGYVKKCPLTGCAGAPTVLATGLGSSPSLAIDATNVYWIDNFFSLGAESLKSVPINGGDVVTLVSVINESYSIATDGVNVYWTDKLNGTVSKVPVNGGAPVTIAAGENIPESLVVDATSVYWVNAGTNGGIRKCTPK